MTDKQPVTPVDASTILICKDSPEGIETFMVVRHHQIDFASGALVFPGGKVCGSDRDPGIRARCEGVDGLDEIQLALQVAAIREAFEESAILFAREEGNSSLVTGEHLAQLDRYREPLNSEDVGILEMLNDEGLTLACDCLQPWAHWITPPMMPKRFNTHFFVARVPDDHEGAHDGSESVDSVWISPERVAREAEEGKWTVIFPTRLNLMMLGESGSVDEAVETARNRAIVTVEPWIEKEGDGAFLCIPPEAGYAISRERADRHA